MDTHRIRVDAGDLFITLAEAISRAKGILFPINVTVDQDSVVIQGNTNYLNSQFQKKNSIFFRTEHGVSVFAFNIRAEFKFTKSDRRSLFETQSEPPSDTNDVHVSQCGGSHYKFPNQLSTNDSRLLSQLQHDHI